MRVESDIKLDFSDVLLRPKRSTLGSRKDVSLVRKYKFRNYTAPVEQEKDYSGIPIIASNMDGVGTMAMADNLALQGLFTCLVKTYSVNDLIRYFEHDDRSHDPDRTGHVAMSIGITEADFNKFSEVYKAVNNKLKYVCVDVANGYTKFFSEYISKLRKQFPNIVIIAGNVVTGDQTQELILNGADIVKVGIGPGSVCTTRIQTGVGYPQLSAVIECADAAHGLGGHVIADGGCTCPGDVAKAFAGGADFVMLGGMLAGHDEGGGDIVTKHIATGGAYKTPEGTYVPYFEEQKFIQFYGMSSDTANKKHFGGLKDYRSSEGRDVLVPYRGKVANTIQDLAGGIRSTCTYVGAPSLKQLSKCATFVRATNQYNRIFAG
tara:strand:- start:4207 stop:5337 length:1131 start_codon:yes stop_codon:yes gene_type:complete